MCQAVVTTDSAPGPPSQLRIIGTNVVDELRPKIAGANRRRRMRGAPHTRWKSCAATGGNGVDSGIPRYSALVP